MRNILSVLVLIIGFSISAFAQNNKGMDESMDRSLTEIESFLDTFNIQHFFAQAFGQDLEKMVPSDSEMQQIQEQMKLGFEQLRGFDMSIFEGFVKEMEKNFPDMDNRLFEQPVPNTPIPSKKPTKKI